MSNSKFMADWNACFDYQLAESDLQRPTEMFLFNVFREYFKKIDLDFTALIEETSNTSKDLRLSAKVKLCAYIDHLYKISCAENCFCYLDLIKPSPKKTVHMLKVLLNYYWYLEMLRNETLTLAEGKVKEFHKISSKHNKCQVDGVKYELQLNELRKNKTDFETRLPELLAQIELYRAKEKTQMDNLLQVQDTIRNYETILAQLKFREEELRCDVVSDKEAETVSASKAALEKAITEQEEIEKGTIANNKDYLKQIDEKQSNIDSIQSTINKYPTENITSLKEMKKKLSEISNRFIAQENKNEKILTAIENQMKIVEQLERGREEKKNVFNAIIKQTEKELLSIQKKIENTNSKNFDVKLDRLEADLQKQRNLGESILLRARQIVDELNSVG